jgi:hypothetical protein
MSQLKLVTRHIQFTAESGCELMHCTEFAKLSLGQVKGMSLFEIPGAG